MPTEVTGIAGLVTVAECARLLHISPDAVRQRIHRHHIRVVKIGGISLVRLTDVKLAGRDD